MQGFSVSNLKFCRLFYKYFSNSLQIENHNVTKILDEVPIGQQPVNQLPWGHIILIISKIKERAVADFYICKKRIN